MLGVMDVSIDKYRLFNTIAIETSSWCTRRCEFCPVSYFPRGDEYMDDGLWRQIINELSVMKYKGRIEMFIYNEPLYDDSLFDKIADIRCHIPRACIMIATNGDLIDSQYWIHYLFDVGLNQLCINLYSPKRARQLRRYTKESGYERYDLSLYANIGPKKKVLQIIDRTGVTRDNHKLPGVHHISNRAGNIFDFVPPLDVPLDKMCTRPFRFLNIMYDGRAMLCCNDYHRVVDVGDCSSMPLIEIWNSDAFNVYRSHLQNKDRRLPLCDVCDFNGGPYQHVIYHVGGVE